MIRLINIVAIALFIIMLIVLFKFDLVCEVTIAGESVGYIANKNEFENKVNEIINKEEEAKLYTTIENMPEYKFKLVNKSEQTNEEAILAKLEENSATTQNIANEEDSESIKIATEKRNEILAIIDKNNKYSEKIKYQKGIITAVIQNLTQYLAKNEDNDVKRYLNDILGQVEAINAYDLINKKQGASSQYNVIVLDYLSQIYKEGINVPKDFFKN